MKSGFRASSFCRKVGVSLDFSVVKSGFRSIFSRKAGVSLSCGIPRVPTRRPPLPRCLGLMSREERGAPPRKRTRLVDDTHGAADDDSPFVPAAGGMAAHNRRLAEAWGLPPSSGVASTAVPLCRLNGDAAAAADVASYLREHWVEEQLLVVDRNGKPAARWQPFALYANTRTPHSASVQAQHTLITRGEVDVSASLRLVPGLSALLLPALQLASRWCAQAPPPCCSPALRSCLT